jgi:exoribonuclease-2
MTQASKFSLIELREGGEVRAAAVLEKSDGKLRVRLADGREVRLPVARVLDRGGEVSVADPADADAVAEAVGAWEEEARSRGAEVDLGELHDLLVEERGAGAVVELAEVAPLVVGDALPQSRAAVHRALAQRNPWFRFDGKRWLVRTLEDVAKDKAKLEEQQRLARERAEFVDAAARRLKGEPVELPEGSDKFLRFLRETAIEGEGAKNRREAGQLVADIRGGVAGHLSQDVAFEVLVGLGDFSEHENLDLLRAGVAREFSPEALAEAERLAAKPVELEPGREDLRELDIVTVDDAGTTEVDDGLSFIERPQGFQLGIHIADASYFIERGSPLDQVALDRATTYYLPGLSIPMLPAVISEQAASLNEGEDRPALSFLIELTPHLEVVSSRITPSLVRVTRRMDYNDCEAVLAGKAPAEDEERWSWLRRLAELADRLEADRIAAGSTPIRAQEVRIKVSPEGRPDIQVLDPGRPARKLVSEMMIFANGIAAQACADRSALAIFRKQGPPNGNVPAPPTDYYDPVRVNAFRRTLQRTVISLEPGPHAGLGLEAYLQATSPIRRYQDLVVHRIIKAFLAGEKRPYGREELQSIAEITEAAGRQARNVENATDEYWILRSYENRIGELVEGVVLRSDHRRTYIELVDTAHRAAIPASESHEPGETIRVMIREAHARRRSLSLEEAG